MPDPGWKLKAESLERLLDRLAADRESGADEYERLRRKLLDFFDNRGSATPDALADETLDRVARKLEQGEVVGHIRGYVYGVARRVLLEAERHRVRERVAAGGLQDSSAAEWAADAERRAACLDRCLAELPEPSRALIVEYYEVGDLFDVDARKHMATRLGITYGTLKTRAHRIRAEMEKCLRACLGMNEAGNR